MNDRWAERFGTLFGLGRSPWAPGTVGSLAALAVGVLTPASIYPWFIAVLAITASLVGPRLADRMIGDGADKDPGRFVFDEAAGMWIAMLRLEKPEGWLTFAIAFALFRLFDITKLWPVGRLERVHGGMGVMLDDIAAGAIALAIGIGVATIMG